MHFVQIAGMIVFALTQFDAATRVGHAARWTAQLHIAILRTHPVDGRQILALHGVHVSIVKEILATSPIGHQPIAAAAAARHTKVICKDRKSLALTYRLFAYKYKELQLISFKFDHKSYLFVSCFLWMIVVSAQSGYLI